MAPFIQLTILAIIVDLSYGQGAILSVQMKPDVDELLLKSGSSQALECSAAGDGNLGCSFPPGAKESYSTKVINGQHEATCTILNFTVPGDYMCEFKEKDTGNVYTESMKVILVEEKKVEPIYQYGSKNATLSCSISWSESKALTIEKVTWKKDDVSALPEGGRFKTDATNSLVIHDPKQEDIGVYTAEMKVQNVATPYKCEVSFKEESVNYNFKGVDDRIIPGNEEEQSAVLTCNSNNSSVVRKIKNVEWLKNNTQLSKLEKPDRFKVNQENYTLTIDDARCFDAGLYIARFTLEGSPEPHDCEAILECRPTVLEFTKNKNLIEKDKMELQCRVQGYPKVEVKWQKDGKELNVSVDERIELYTLDGYKNARLVIKNIEFSDEGVYACFANSSYFNSSSFQKITVRVKDKLAALWPFLGIVCEVIILCTIIFIYEKRRNKRAEQEENKAQEADGPSMEKKDGLRHRGNSGNPGA